MRIFENAPYVGTVTAYFSMEETGSQELWHVLYDDCDEEDLDRKEIITALQSYNAL